MSDVVRLRSRLLRDLVLRSHGDPSDEGLQNSIDQAIIAELTSASLGSPYAFREQYRGEVVQNLRPAADSHQEVSSRSRSGLPLHTDDAFLSASARPDRIALIAIRSSKTAPTIIAELDDVLANLGSGDIECLRSPRFVHLPPASFDGLRPAHGELVPRPVLRSVPGGNSEIAMSARLPVRRMDESPQVTDSIVSLRAAAQAAPREAVQLSPGEILVVSNSRLLHGRSGYLGERWLKRVYLRSDLRTLDEVAATASPGVYSAAAALLQNSIDRPDW